jgi:hypothetical protein
MLQINNLKPPRCRHRSSRSGAGRGLSRSELFEAANARPYATTGRLYGLDTHQGDRPRCRAIRWPYRLYPDAAVLAGLRWAAIVRLQQRDAANKQVWILWD